MKRRKYRNPLLNTSGYVCDFCGKPGVAKLYATRPYALNDISRTQFAACPTCSKLLDGRDLIRFVQMYSKLMPSNMPLEQQIQSKKIFKRDFEELFKCIIGSRDIGPEDIMQLTQLRAEAKRIPCEFRTGHPLLGACNKLAYIGVKTQERVKKSCWVCAAQSLGVDSIDLLINHPNIVSI